MDSSLETQLSTLTDLIQFPLDKIEGLVCEWNQTHDGDRPVIDTQMVGLPLMIKFGRSHVVFSCDAASETLRIHMVDGDYDPRDYLPAIEEREALVSVPLMALISWHWKDYELFVNSISLIERRQCDGCFDGLVAVVFHFSSTVSFGFAVGPADFSTLVFNEHCEHLICEARDSHVHKSHVVERTNPVIHPLINLLATQSSSAG